MAFESSSATISVAANYAALWNHWISSSLPTLLVSILGIPQLCGTAKTFAAELVLLRICEAGLEGRGGEKVWRFGCEGSDDLSVEEGAKFRLDLLLRDAWRPFSFDSCF